MILAEIYTKIDVVIYAEIQALIYIQKL